MFIPFCFYQAIEGAASGLLADYGNFGAGNFQAHQAAIGVEHQQHLEVAGGDPQAFITFSVVRCGAGGFHRNRAGREVLRN